jgi:dTDP-4-dehydrorhamnose reductase
MRETVLITGAKGQLGNEIRKIACDFEELNFLFTDVQELDITNLTDVNHFFSEYKPKIIINCAAYTAVDKAESDREMAFRINVTGPENLAMAAKETGAFLLHVSTDFVFEGVHSIPYTEDDKPNPTGEYGKTKLLGEEAILKVGGDAAIVRTAWLYSAENGNFLNTMMRLGAEKPTLNVVFDQIGTPTAAHDLAKTLLVMAQKKLAGNSSLNEIFHYSNEGVCSWYDFAVRIMKLANLPCKVNPIHTYEYPTPAKRPAYSVLDKTKIKKALEISIPHWEDSLEMVIREKQKTT